MSGLIRDPAEWATSSGWISRRRAQNIAAKLDDLVERIAGAVGDDDGVMEWLDEIRQVSKTLAPKTTRDERRIAAMRVAS